MKKIFSLLSVVPLLATTTAYADSTVNTTSSTPATTTYSLKFDPTDNYTLKTFKVNGKEIKVRAYENLVYVANPVDVSYESLNIYIPVEYFEGKSVNGYTVDTAPIFFPNAIGGYMPAKPITIADDSQSSNNQSKKPLMDNSQASKKALEQGLVVVSPGALGRTLKDTQGKFYGKAPAAIIDLKAAVRYLHANDAVMPGTAKKIISNGTSAGAALSVLLAASGDSPDYNEALQARGAAQASDVIFAASAYAPITNLDHADAAYEWLFSKVHNYQAITINMLDYNVKRVYTNGTLTPEQIKVSQDLFQQFPPYLNNLHLTDAQGNDYQLNADGTGSFADLVASYLAKSAQEQLDAGVTLDTTKYPWLTISENKVTQVNLPLYAQTVVRQKTPPAFDALDLSAGENNLFGTATLDSQHFTPYSMEHSTAENATMADAQVIKMMNPMNYLERSNGVAKYWRVRHGTVDKDTSLAIPTILATKLQNLNHQVDYALAWDKPHSGDYDLEQLFAWINKIAAN